jgi:hypothetical protein
MQPNTTLAIAISALLAVTAGGATARGRQSDPPTSTSHGGHAGPTPSAAMVGPAAHSHGAPVPAITFAELKHTAEQLDAARKATEKYQDVRAAEGAGYHAVGPNVAGMGVHYVRQTDHQHFSITEPPILLYERDPAADGGLRLVGVSYLLVPPLTPTGSLPARRFRRRWPGGTNTTMCACCRTTVPRSISRQHSAQRAAVALQRRRVGWCTHGSGRTALLACSARRILWSSSGESGRAVSSWRT